MSILDILIAIVYSLAGLLTPKNRNSRIGDTGMEVHILEMIGKDQRVMLQASQVVVHGIA